MYKCCGNAPVLAALDLSCTITVSFNIESRRSSRFPTASAFSPTDYLSRRIQMATVPRTFDFDQADEWRDYLSGPAGKTPGPTRSIPVSACVIEKFYQGKGLDRRANNFVCMRLIFANALVIDSKTYTSALLSVIPAYVRECLPPPVIQVRL
jgi:hypothetical protein